MSSLFRRQHLRNGPETNSTVSGEHPGKEIIRSSTNEKHSIIENRKSKGSQEDKEEDYRSSRRSSRLYSLFGIPTSFLSRRKSLEDTSIPSVSTESRRRFTQALKSPKVPKSQKAAPLPSDVARKGPEGIVTLLIGPEHTPYYLHRDFLMHHSGYFKKALAGPWKEAEERVVTLSDVDVEPFDVLVHFLYTSSIPKDTAEWVKISKAKRWKIEVIELKVLVLADRFLMPELLQAVNNDLVASRMKHAPYYELVIYAWENLPQGSPILRLLVDTHVANWEPKTDEGDEEELQLRPDLPHEFLVKVMIRYAEVADGVRKTSEREKKGIEKGEVKGLKACDYHMHVDDEEKEKCGNGEI
jgi:hypothetical protein